MIHERIDPGFLLPAVAQGTLALETRAGDPLREELAAVQDRNAAITIAAERAFLERLEGDCSVPLAAFAEVAGDDVRLRGLVAAPDGARIVRGERSGATRDAAAKGTPAPRATRTARSGSYTSVTTCWGKTWARCGW